MGPSGAAWGTRPCGARGSRGAQAAAIPARTLALSSAAASTLFSDMVPGPGLAGSRGPGAGTEGPWTAEGGRGRNLARWRRRRRQRHWRPLSKLDLWKRRQRRAGWGGGGSGAETRRAAAVHGASGRAVRAVAGTLRPRSLGPRLAAPRTRRAAADQPLPPPGRETAYKGGGARREGLPRGGAGGSGEERRREEDESGGWRGGDRRMKARGGRAREAGGLDREGEMERLTVSEKGVGRGGGKGWGSCGEGPLRIPTYCL